MVSAATVARRARASAAAAWGRRAAGILLALATAGAAYAAPGSPLPGWMARLAGRSVVPAPARPPAGPPPAPEPTLATGGIVVAPGARFAIQFAAAQPVGVAVVSLADGPDIVARSSGGPATFTTDESRLTIGNRGSSASYEIELPRGAPRIELLLGDRRLLLKDDARVTTAAPVDARGRWTVRLAEP